MSHQRAECWSRREFLGGLTLAGTAGLRLFKIPEICLAPQYVAEDLLRAEGFTDVQYLEFPEGATDVTGRLA